MNCRLAVLGMAYLFMSKNICSLISVAGQDLSLSCGYNHLLKIIINVSIINCGVCIMARITFSGHFYGNPISLAV
jgi:hypothetical protein